MLVYQRVLLVPGFWQFTKPSMCFCHRHLKASHSKIAISVRTCMFNTQITCQWIDIRYNNKPKISTLLFWGAIMSLNVGSWLVKGPPKKRMKLLLYVSNFWVIEVWLISDHDLNLFPQDLISKDFHLNSIIVNWFSFFSLVFNWFQLVSIDFQSKSIYFPLISIHLQLTSICFSVISMYFQWISNHVLFQCTLNWFQITFKPFLGNTRSRAVPNMVKACI